MDIEKLKEANSVMSCIESHKKTIKALEKLKEKRYEVAIKCYFRDGSNSVLVDSQNVTDQILDLILKDRNERLAKLEEEFERL